MVNTDPMSKIAVMADKYGMKDLVEQTAKQIRSLTSESLTSNTILEFIKAAELAYSHNLKHHQGLIQEIAVENRLILNGKPRESGKSLWIEFLAQHQEAALDFAQQFLRHQCPKHRR
jgi:hypothetical protein